MGAVTYRVRLVFPCGVEVRNPALAGKRSKLELAAKSKLQKDLLENGYKMADETFRVKWDGLIDGYAYATGVKE